MNNSDNNKHYFSITIIFVLCQNKNISFKQYMYYELDNKLRV